MSKARTLADKATTGRKNFIINGDFDIWQRGNSQGVGGYGSADRWYLFAADGSLSSSRQAFTLGQTVVPNNPRYFIRVNRLTAATVSNLPIYQRVESVTTLAGTTATLTFWANLTLGKELAIRLTQVFGTGGTPSANILTDAPAIVGAGEWAKYVLTISIPSISGKTLGSNGDDFLQVAFVEDSVFSTFTLDLAQVQLEKGNLATDFEKRPIGEELALCQRFYWRGCTGNGFNQFTTGSGQNASWHIPFPVTMRAIPSVSHVNVAGYFYTDFSFDTPSKDGAKLIAKGSSGANASSNIVISSNGYLEADAEL